MPQRPSLNVSWPGWITEHKDDPEEDSPQSDDETAEELGQVYDAESWSISCHGQVEGTHRRVQH